MSTHFGMISGMKTMTEAEIDQILSSLNSFLGWELQNVFYNEKALLLKLYCEGKDIWLVFSIKPGVPYLCYSTGPLFLIKKLKKPLALFINTHFVGEKLVRIKRVKKLGRVVDFSFGEGKDLQLSLVTGRVNISAQVDEKQVFAYKPKKIFEQEPSVFDRDDLGGCRDNDFFLKHWQSFNEKTKRADPKDVSKLLKKKQSGLDKMEEKLKQLKRDPWKLTGTWLKNNQSLVRVPVDLLAWVDVKESLSWNIENCFTQSKKNKGKIEGTQLRIQALQAELAALADGHWDRTSRKKSQVKNLLGEASLKGKTVDLPCGRMFIGKSGLDNLKLLRKAKPWYFWLHIKDYPGAHGVIEVTKKNSKLDKESIEQAAQAVVRQSLPKNQTGSFEVIYCECRYVRPIKGAKSGQVTYSHETVVSIKV